MADIAEKNEADILRALRSRYEKDGYTFLPHPTRELVPAFLGNYRPDALAISDQGSVVIEVKTRRSGNLEPSLARIAAIVEAQPNWTFRVFYTSGTSRPAYRAPSKAAVFEMADEVERLQKAGFDRAAFVMAWSALEAFTRALHAKEENSDKAMMPSEIIEWLSQSGNIDPPTGRMLRSLVRTRNALVHGDISTKIDPYHLVIMNVTLQALKAELKNQ